MTTKYPVRSVIFAIAFAWSAAAARPVQASEVVVADAVSAADAQGGSSSLQNAGDESGGGTQVDRPPTSKEDAAGRPALPMDEYVRPFSRVGGAVTVGSMGIGLEAATPLQARTDLRFTGNFFAYTDNASRDSFKYAARLRLRSFETSLDWYPFHSGFHVSPGFYFFGGNQVSGHANVPSGRDFTLNGTEYISSATDPIKGSGQATVNGFGPQLTVGWGNLLPRGKRFSFPFEIGGAYQGRPTVVLKLTGSACDNTGQNCQPVANLPDFQQNLRLQLLTVNSEASPYRYYPIVSIGVAYKF